MRHYEGQVGPATFVWREPCMETVRLSRFVGRISPDKYIRRKRWVRVQETLPGHFDRVYSEEYFR